MRGASEERTMARSACRTRARASASEVVRGGPVVSGGSSPSGWGSFIRLYDAASARRSGRFDTTPVPALSAVSSGTRLPTRIASVAERRAELSPR